MEENHITGNIGNVGRILRQLPDSHPLMHKPCSLLRVDRTWEYGRCYLNNYGKGEGFLQM